MSELSEEISIRNADFVMYRALEMWLEDAEDDLLQLLEESEIERGTLWLEGSS